ncbi:MAG: DUF167 domain-containing protein [archaeon]
MRLNIKVQPNSGRQEIKQISENEYKIFLKKSPEDNKANEELIKLLSKKFNSKVNIIKGRTSKRKVIELNQWE